MDGGLSMLKRMFFSGLFLSFVGVPHFAFSFELPPTNSCFQMSEDFCSTLWSDENKGHLKLTQEELHLGSSMKSDLSYGEVEHLRTILNSESKLPNYLSKALSSQLKELKQLLKTENDSIKWSHKYSLLKEQWKNRLTDLVTERLVQKYPDLKKVAWESMSLDQQKLYFEFRDAMDQDFFNSLYQSHPRWKRFQKLFQQAQKNIVDTISEMALPLEEKMEMIETIQSVKLNLPYHSLGFGSDDSCSISEFNASYRLDRNTITVCIPMIHGVGDSDGAVYQLIAHELSHSIDPANKAYRKFLIKGFSAQLLRPLVASSTPPFSCQQWSQILSQSETELFSFHSIYSDPLQNLYDCLIPKDELQSFDFDNINFIAQHQANQVIRYSAENHSFTKLSQTQPLACDKKENEFFLRPDRLWLKSYQQSVQPTLRSPITEEVFSQSLFCQIDQLDNKVNTYSLLDSEKKKILIQTSLQQTKEVLKTLQKEAFRYCGKNCESLELFNLSKNSGENFSDWMSYRSMTKYLENIPNPELRKESALAGSALDCNQRNSPNLDRHISQVEKKYATEPHPLKFDRRMALFNSKNTKLLNCELEPKYYGFGQCQVRAN